MARAAERVGAARPTGYSDLGALDLTFAILDEAFDIATLVRSFRLGTGFRDGPIRNWFVRRRGRRPGISWRTLARFHPLWTITDLQRSCAPRSGQRDAKKGRILSHYAIKSHRSRSAVARRHVKL